MTTKLLRTKVLTEWWQPRGQQRKCWQQKWLTKVVTKLTINVLTTKLFTWSASTPPLFCESPPILPGSCQERFPLAEKECFVFYWRSSFFLFWWFFRFCVMSNFRAISLLLHLTSQSGWRLHFWHGLQKKEREVNKLLLFSIMMGKSPCLQFPF